MAQDKHLDSSREQNGEGDNLQNPQQVAAEMAKVSSLRAATDWPSRLIILTGLPRDRKVSNKANSPSLNRLD